jgi:hypothetical protein
MSNNTKLNNIKTSLFCLVYYIIVIIVLMISDYLTNYGNLRFSLGIKILSEYSVLIISVLLGILSIFLIKNPIASKITLLLETFFILIPALFFDISLFLPMFLIINHILIANVEIFMAIGGFLSVIEIYRIINFVKKPKKI